MTAPQQPVPPGSQPPYGRPPYPQQAYGQPPAPNAAPRNVLALVSVILGAVPLLFGLVLPLLALVFAHGAGYNPNLYGIISGLLSVLGFVLGATALALGLVAVFRRGLPKALAGVGVGLGIAAVWDSLIALSYPLIMSLGGY